MTTVLLVIHFFIAAFLVITILLQKSEGGALSGLGGGTGGLMSARGSANLLTRITSILVAAFFISSILIAIRLHSPESGNSIIDTHEKNLEMKEQQEASKPAVEKAEEAPAAAPTAPAPHTEGESKPVALPQTAAEPLKPTEPIKGVEPAKPAEPKKDSN
jgi:preprotein translocase subunit SecG